MSTNIINDLDAQLASLNQLKPPGASKGKITSITQLCVSNIQAEATICTSLYRALKKAPATHKLGAIYVIDSVTRKWIDSAKKEGQELHVEGRGEPGTFPAAVKRVTELMPALFIDLMKGIPAEQKDKVEGMVKIWEKGSTFPAKMLADFRAQLSGTTNQAAVQTNGTSAAASNATVKKVDKFAAPIPSRPLSTPLGFPPDYLYSQGYIPEKFRQPQTNGHAVQTVQAQAPPAQAPPAPAPQPPAPQQQAAAPPSDVNSILAALANSAAKPAPQQQQQQQQPPPPTQMPQLPQNIQQQLPASLAALFGQQNGALAFPPPPQFQTYAAPQQAPAFQMPQQFAGFPVQPPPSVPQHNPYAPPPQQPPPQQQQQAPSADLLGPLRGILPSNILNDKEKLVQALNLLQELQRDGIPMDQWGPVISAFEAQFQAPQQSSYGNYNDQGRGRNRSRSPERNTRRRASPVYGTYEDMRKQNEDGYHNDRRYRQRSPMRNSPTPGMSTTAMNGNPMQPKFIAIDNNLPNESIKVLSRTLFVGGANGSQQEIQSLFERFGQVQTCIANRDKRHAFVKMTTRNHALSAKEQMERLQQQNDREVMNVARQTKWGVGFGPRECCDYAKGESIIPINKLTDADVKWLLTAEYGGTGGRKIEGGMVLEEPDIEIGAGVSSKAMSKRVGPDGAQASNNFSHNNNNNGNKSRRDDNRKGRKQHQDDGYGSGGGYGGQQPAYGMPPQQSMQQFHQPMEAYGYARPEPVAVATPPAVPGFGFALPGSGAGMSYL